MIAGRASHKAGLGEPGYKAAPVDGLAEAVAVRDLPAGCLTKAGLGEPGYKAARLSTASPRPLHP